MIDYNDERWIELKGGYRTRFDPRPALSQIRDGVRSDEAWTSLWEDLHHQGDVGEASYAAVPFLVEFCRARREYGWNLFAMIAVIELSRENAGNPPLPDWLERDYRDALQAAYQLASDAVAKSADVDEVRAARALLALQHGEHAVARELL